MIDWYRVILLAPFDESKDEEEGGSALMETIYVLTGVVTLLLVIGQLLLRLSGRPAMLSVFGIIIALCAIQAGAAWHLRMPGKAKNGFYRAVFCCNTLVIHLDNLESG